MKRTTFYFLGLALVALGVTSIRTANIGVNAWDSVYNGLNIHFEQVSIGSWLFIIGIILLFINKLLTRGKIDISAILTIFLLGNFVNLYLAYIFHFQKFENLVYQISFFLLGFFILSLGIAIYMQADFGRNPIDSLMVNIHDKFGLSIRTSRTICEVFALSIGFLLGGPVSFGTIIITLFLGPSIQLLLPMVKQIYLKK